MLAPFAFLAAARRAMRRHQDLPERPARIPMWRLLAGELAWGLRQLVSRPPVLAAFLGAGLGTFAVLSTAAPGPVFELPLRVLAAIAIGLLLAAGVRRIADAHRTGVGRDRSLLGATVISAALAAVVLLVWLGVWLVGLLL